MLKVEIRNRFYFFGKPLFRVKPYVHINAGDDSISISSEDITKLINELINAKNDLVYYKEEL